MTCLSVSNLFQLQKFEVYSNKRRSPVLFDPTFTSTSNSTGKWYVNCKDERASQTNALYRIHLSDFAERIRTTDTWFTRLKDGRDADDRTYKLRYVIPSYLENARDPINGFVIKTRTDDTRRLVPQKIVLKPVSGNVYGARFVNPIQTNERIGFTSDDIEQNSLNEGAQTKLKNKIKDKKE